MNVCVTFKHIYSRSGVDVWVNMLAKNVRLREHINTKVEYYPWYCSIYPELTKIKKFKKCRASKCYEIVHSNLDYAYVFKTKNQPLVSTAHHIVHKEQQYLRHASSYQKAYYTLLFRYQRKSLEYSDIITAVSNYTKKKIEEVFDFSDVKVIYNGIDTSIYRPLPNIRDSKIITINNRTIKISDKKTILLFSGNLHKRKGFDIIVELLKLFKKRGSQDKFILLFTGLKSTQTTLFSNFKNIIPLGRLSLSDLVRVYTVADIFVFPSRLEGFGLSIAEAMACEKPVISTFYSSIPELIVDGKGGILCYDIADYFYDAIIYLSEDEWLIRKMGKFNRRRVLKMFELTRMVREYVKLYKKL